MNPSATLHEAFDATAARYANRVALSCQGRSLTYAELIVQANRLARALQQHGVRRGNLVGLCVVPSPNLVVSILAILKTGAACVPIDPSWPAERMAFVVRDTRVAALIVDRSCAGHVAHAETCVIDVHDELQRIAGHPEARPSCTGVDSDELAYVIYVSGSDGRLKGVELTHGNVLNLVASTEQWCGLHHDDVWLLSHPSAHVVSIWELAGALLSGGRLVVASHRDSGAAEAYRELLVAEKVTTLIQTPSAFQHFVRADMACADGDGLNLRTVILTGETLEIETIEPWLKRRRDARPRVMNAYGITEATGPVTYRQISRGDGAQWSGSVIGEPTLSAALYLLDDDMEPVPLGVVGELYVGGDGVARGYVHRPMQTAGRFVPDPFSGRPGARMYRSGDLVRRLSNGDLLFCGRIDDRGEAQERVPEPCGVASPSEDDLRAALAARLPEHMMPSAFVFLDRLPLTANGKIDRQRLPSPDWDATHAHRYIAPRTALEDAVSRIWATVLGVDRIGATDSFFARGGHSLTAIHAASLIRDALGADLPLRAFFDMPTVEAFARGIEQHLAATLPQSELRDLLDELETVSDDEARGMLASTDANAASE